MFSHILASQTLAEMYLARYPSILVSDVYIGKYSSLTTMRILYMHYHLRHKSNLVESFEPQVVANSLSLALTFPGTAARWQGQF